MKKALLLFCLLLITGSIMQAQTVDVTFKVDMSTEIATARFNPALDTVRIRGSFDGWGAGLDMNDSDNDSVYIVIMTGQPQSTAILHKFYHTGNSGNGWESDPNREINTGTSATLDLPVYFFDHNPAYFDGRTPYTNVTSSITFNVDMKIPLRGAMELSDHAYVAGNFTDWGTGAVEMFDPNSDSIYTATINTLTSGNLAMYKFIWSTGAASSGTWETNEPTGVDIFGNDRNRIYGIVDGQDTVSRFWQNTNPTVTLGDGNIFFVVDMSVANELGVFNNSVDSVQIRGGFNGWNDSDPPRSVMNQDVNPNVWFLDVPFIQYEINLTMYYKFFIKNGTGSTPYANTGWEVPISPTNNGDRNRTIIFEANPTQTADYVWFEGIHTDWVIPSGTTVQATFSVDMTSATDFDPAADSVVWIPRQPFYYAVHNLPWPGEYPRVLYLTDTNADLIYEGTLTVTGPDFNGFLYNYGYVDVSASNALVQEGGSQGECRVRYIAQTGPRTFVNPYSFPQDIWTASGEKPEENPPTSIDEILGVIPDAYSLDQNYPNPFNPSTLIRFSVPEQGLVNIKVYNLLGEVVATLVNGEFATGSYEVNFDATNLSSGVYFYSISANNFVATKKMMLIK